MVNLELDNQVTESETLKDIEKSFDWKNTLNWLHSEESQVQTEILQNWKKWKEDAMDHINKWEIWYVAKYLDNYQWLDSEVADILIKNWYMRDVKSHFMKTRLYGSSKIEKTSFICDKNLAILFIKNKEWMFVARYIELYEGRITPNEVIKLCIQYKYDKYFERDWYTTIGVIIKTLLEEWAQNFDNDIANYLMEYWYEEKWGETGLAIIKKYLKRFQWLDNKIAESLINSWAIKNVINNLSSFSEIDQIGLIDKAMGIGVDFDFLCENQDNFNEEWKKHILEIRKQLNYHMVKDIDGEIKTTEKIIDRIKDFISNVDLPASNKLSIADVKLLWWDYDVTWFEIIVISNGPRDPRRFRIDIDPKSWRETFIIPGLEWLKFKDNDEFVRIVNLLMRLHSYTWIVKDIRTNPYCDEYYRSGWRLRIHRYWFMWQLVMPEWRTTVLKKKTIDEYYPSIKNNKEFLDFINSKEFYKNGIEFLPSRLDLL